jgi:hypothetical protein
MAIHNLDPVDTIVLPDKTDSPLAIDAEAVLLSAIAFK